MSISRWQSQEVEGNGKGTTSSAPLALMHCSIIGTFDPPEWAEFGGAPLNMQIRRLNLYNKCGENQDLSGVIRVGIGSGIGAGNATGSGTGSGESIEGEGLLNGQSHAEISAAWLYSIWSTYADVFSEKIYRIYKYTRSSSWKQIQIYCNIFSLLK